MMTPAQWAQVRSLYETVLELAVEAQPVYLQRACSDLLVRTTVTQMLADRKHLPGWLETPLLPVPMFRAEGSPATVGRRVGAYVLERELGRGGMGVVYLAARADDAYRKQVAIKFLGPGLPEDQKRFQRERQILADLDHPGIARLLDGNVTPEGWPYIVMEYVEGFPITEFCDQQWLDCTARVRLMLKVCEAVEYAHQHRVIHRDLKPANLLVTADGTPRLLDFGIAKLLDTEFSTGFSLSTHTGMHAMTPDYASPEQMRGADITPASDVYSLGVLLYELLTGQRPFRLDGKPLHEAVRIVSEDDPPRPSAVVTEKMEALAQDGSSQRTLTPEARSQPREGSVAQLRVRLHGDLDNIVLRALRKTPTERYPTVAALRADLERHLHHEPVSAREPTWRYRAHRFVRRHRVGVTVAALLLAGLLIALGAALGQAHTARLEAQQARRMLYLTQMQQAARQLEQGVFAEVRALLERWQPSAGADDLRGFEWFYLWREAHRERLELHHNDDVGTVAWAPNGQKIASAGQDRLVKVWDARTGNELLVFKGHTGTVGNVAFSPDSRWMASAGEDQHLRLWDAATGQEQWHHKVGGPHEYSIAFAPNGATLAVVAQNALLLVRMTTGERLFSVNLEMALQKVAFFPDGRRLVTGGQDEMLRVWDAATGQQLRSVRAHPGSFVFTVAVSPDGRWIASGGNDPVGNGKAARLWQAETLQEHKVLARHTNAVRSVAFAPDSQTLVTASADQQIKGWDIASGRELKTWRGHTNRIREVAFAPDGKSIASASDDGTVKVWNVDPTAEPAEILTGHDGRIIPLAVSPDGATVATGSSDLTVRLWDLPTGQERHSLRGHFGETNSVAFSPDGRRLLTGNNDCTFRTWEVSSGQPLALYENHHPGGPAVAFLPGGQAVFGREMNGAYVLIDVRTGREVRTFKGHARAVDVADFSPDGKWLLTRSGGETARVWEVATGQEIRHFEAGDLTDPRGIYACDLISPDGRKAFTWSTTGNVQSWEVTTGRRSRLFRKRGERIRSLTLSTNGRVLATLTPARAVRLWDTTTGKEMAALDCPDCGPFARFSPDGKWLAAITSDQSVRVWEVATRREAHLLRGHTKEVLCLEWSPDSRQLASGGTDSTAILWNANTGQQVRTYSFKTHIGWVLFSPDGSKLLTQGNDAVGLWEVESGKLLAGYDYAMDAGRGPVLSAIFSPDGRRIATTTAASTTALWEAEGGRILNVFRGAFSTVWNTRFAPDGQTLVSASWDKTARVWDVTSGRELVQFTGHQNPVTAAVFTPDGKFIASGGDDRTVRLWEAATGREVRTFTGHAAAIRAVAFSPDGRRLASGSVDKTVRVWDVESGQELLTLHGHTDEVWSVAFAPDGRTLVSGSWDKTARLWRTASDLEVNAQTAR